MGNVFGNLAAHDGVVSYLLYVWADGHTIGNTVSIGCCSRYCAYIPTKMWKAESTY